jgi:hypothetical protein
MTKKYFVVDNFLDDSEKKLLAEVDSFNTYTSSKGNTIDYYQPKNIDSIFKKIEEKIGSFVIRDYYVYNIKKPYRIHNDAGKNKKSFYTVIIPLHLAGGLYILNQYSEETFLIDDYLSLDGQKNMLLDIEARQRNIVNYDSKLCLPDIPQLSHIKDFDKIGFSIDAYIEFNNNRAIFFESKYYHCSENTNDFTNKQSLVIFLDRE